MYIFFAVCSNDMHVYTRIISHVHVWKRIVKRKKQANEQTKQQTSVWQLLQKNRKQYTLNVRSRGKQLGLFSRKSWCFPRRSRGNHQDSRENKTNWFPEGPDIKCFVIFLDFHFNSNKRITGANQSSRLGTYKNTNLNLKTTEWMIYKVLSYHLHLFPALAAVSLLR